MDTRGDWSQRKQRSEMTFTDQHGRPYYGATELKTGDVVGLIEMLFQAPLMPPQKYLERVPKQPYTLYINYERWENDTREARRDWEREGRQLSRRIHGDAYDPSKPFSRDILDIIGEPPQAIEPIIAAKQGNKWVLGLTNRVDLRLVEYFEPEALDPEIRASQEPDFRDEDDDLDEVTDVRGHRVTQDEGGRVPVKTSRPQTRAAAKASGGGKQNGQPRPERRRDEKGRLLPKEPQLQEA